MVVIVNVELCIALEPFAVRLGGRNVQVDPAGSPEQVKLTVPV